MNAFSQIVALIAALAFIGVGIYTIVGGWHILGDFGVPRREMKARIPPPIRKLGVVSISVFLGCLVVLFIARLIFR